MTNKELSQVIRNELKTYGYNTRMVSVSVKNSLYDTAVRITIKSPEVNKRDIENIMKKYEEIDRDERTGEILGGCNIYVFVSYECGIFDEVSKPFIPQAITLYNNSEECIRVIDNVCITNIDGRKEIRQSGKDYCCYYVDSPKQLAEFLYKIDKFGAII